MAVDYEKSLKSLRTATQEAEKKKVQLETRKEAATADKAKYEQEAEDLGVNPAEIDEHVEKLEKEIEAILSKVKEHLPDVESDDDDAAF